MSLRGLVLRLFSFTGLVGLVACSSSSTGGASQDASACDAAACQSIANQIIANGGNAGTCTNPPANFAAACKSYDDCLKSCE
ncbi:MAG TPA: hypothetical protein VIF15_06845 [Polyangiaceae bacterium]|jgi:hypothetical protein